MSVVSTSQADKTIPNKCKSCEPKSVGASSSHSNYTPNFTGSYASRQKQWIEYYGIKVGTALRITRAYKCDEDGYNGISWPCTGVMSTFVRERGTGGIEGSDGLCHPYFVLEPVTVT